MRKVIQFPEAGHPPEFQEIVEHSRGCLTNTPGTPLKTGQIIKFESVNAAEEDDLKRRLCEAMDKGDWFIGVTYDRDNDKAEILTSFDAVAYKVFAKGLLHHAADCLHDHTKW